jgi:hypothetical protein
VINNAVIKLFVSTTNDDPNGVSPTWSPWEEFMLSDYTARGFRFKLYMEIEQAEHQLQVTELSVSIDAVDRTIGQDNVAVSAGGFSVVFDGAFATTPAIAISIDAMQNGDYYSITSRSPAGFTAQIFDINNNPVARQIDWIATGYGRKV